MIFSRRQNKSRITIGDALHGTRVGRLQSVGYMQVIPLLSDLEDERFVSPVEASSEVATQAYGALLFTNPSDPPLPYCRIAAGPLSSRIFNILSAIRSSASSQPIGRKPSPSRNKGVVSRSGEYWRSRNRRVREQRNPRVTGCSGSPARCVAGSPHPCT